MTYDINGLVYAFGDIYYMAVVYGNGIYLVDLTAGVLWQAPKEVASMDDPEKMFKILNAMPRGTKLIGPVLDVDVSGPPPASHLQIKNGDVCLCDSRITMVAGCPSTGNAYGIDLRTGRFVRSAGFLLMKLSDKKYNYRTYDKEGLRPLGTIKEMLRI